MHPYNFETQSLFLLISIAKTSGFFFFFSQPWVKYCKKLQTAHSKTASMSVDVLDDL